MRYSITEKRKFVIMRAPFIAPVNIDCYLSEDQIEQVLCDGENYGGTRPCHYEWVKALRDECAAYDGRSCSTVREDAS